jgi:alpha-glucuronidase
LAFNSNYTKRFFTSVLLVIGLNLFSNLYAEDGYETWLRYEKIDSPELLKEYRLLFKNVIVKGESQTMKVISIELKKGLSGLLGKNIEFKSLINSSGNLIATF